MTLAGIRGVCAKMRIFLRNLAVALVTAGMLTGLAADALAHAVVMKAQPALDQQVAPGPLAIQLEFNSRIDKERSKLELTAPDGAKTEIPIAQDGAPNTLGGTTAALGAGAYSLRWQVLSVDGHITRGDIPFTVAQ
jgi:methionine-rich copper-binding protein CopC